MPTTGLSLLPNPHPKDAVINADMITSGESAVDDISSTNSTERTDASYYVTIMYKKLKVRKGV